MSGVGAGGVLLSQTPLDNYRRLNDVRFTDAYIGNIIQPVYDAFPDQVERLPLETLSGLSVNVPAGTTNTSSLTFPEDGYVQTILINCGLQPAGSAVGNIAMELAQITDFALRARWYGGTILGLGRDGFTDFVTFNFNSQLFVRTGDILTARIRNTTAGLVTGVTAQASYRRLQP